MNEYKWDHWGCGDDCNCNYIELREKVVLDKPNCFGSLIEWRKVWESSWFNFDYYLGNTNLAQELKETHDEIRKEILAAANKFDIDPPPMTGDYFWHEWD